MIPYGRQDIVQADIDAVVKVLKSDFLTQGPAVPHFEEIVANYCGARHAIAVNSATSALHISCMALGLGVNDWLWTSPITFVASANCARYCGANVDFVDVDARTYNMCPQLLEEKLRKAKAQDRLPKIVVPVHFGGQSANMQAIHALSLQYDFKIIEDASHAIGGRYQNRPVGNLRHSDIVIFSFHPVKIITTGEGGMALTNDENIARRMTLLRSHGITRDASAMLDGCDGTWYYQQIELGYNYRLTDLHAALGISQMPRLDAYVARRHEIAGRYDELLAMMPVTKPWQHPDAFSAYHLYPVRLQLKEIGKSRREVFDNLRDAGIGVNVHYIPVHLQPYYKNLGFDFGDFPEAEKYYAEAISLPMFPSLSDMQQDHVVEALDRAVK